MKRSIFLSACFLFFSLFACQPPEEPAETPMIFSSLEGTWQLITFREDGDTTWKKHPTSIIYEKYITPTHFTWVSFDVDKDSLLGTGGGTYVYDSIQQTYTEDIAFFLPAGSNEMGQAIPFEVGYEEGKWYHKGYAKVLEFDPDRGENIVVDSSLIEEIWERTAAPSSNAGLIGTWRLESFKDDSDSLRSDYPDFVSYMKLITPTHFLWVHYIGEQDLVLAEGGGTYQYNGNTYVETLNMVYPSGSNQVGTILPFDCSVEDNTWYHTGHIRRVTTDPESGAEITVDSSKIDEVWKRHQPEI